MEKKNRRITMAYEPCIVSFIDVLGFRDILSKRSAEDVYVVLQSLKNSTRPDEDTYKKYTKNYKKYKNRKRLSSRAFSYVVSDAVVRVRPYDTEFRDGALIWELLELLHAQIEMVNLGVMIRAGVTVGDAHIGPAGKGPVFGTALARAYEIESNEAIFPRIVVDDILIKLHRTDKRLCGEQNNLQYEAKILKEILAIGEDGTHFIDYLNAHDEFNDLETYFDFLSRHADLIRDNLKQNSKNNKILRKYIWLARYHDSHVKKWLSNTTSTDECRDAFILEYETNPEEFFKSLYVLRK